MAFNMHYLCNKYVAGTMNELSLDCNQC